MACIELSAKKINNESMPYIIAEIGVNHEGSIELAKKLIVDAKEGGADGAKFQTYKAAKLACKESPSYWDLEEEKCTSQYELFSKYDNFGEEDYRELKCFCDKVNIDFLSTPFDLESVEFLDKIMPFFKISSSDITNVPLLRRIASKGKPIVLSTGASNIEEIDFALNIIKDTKKVDIALLHCILNYPTPNKNANLGMITDLSAKYRDYVIGYSDHTMPDEEMFALTTSYILGARIIEKHFTHDKTLPGNDHYHAMNKNDLKIFIAKIEKAKQFLGSYKKNYIAEEILSREQARRSIVANKFIKSGTVIKESDLITKRPASGIKAEKFDEIINKTTLIDINEDQQLKEEWLK